MGGVIFRQRRNVFFQVAKTKIKYMNHIEILVVEDNKDDAELILRALKKVNLANHLLHVNDGAEALDFIFAKGQYKNINGVNTPNVILLDIKMPKVDGI